MRILQWWRCQFGGKTILVQVSALCIGNMSLVLIHGKKLPEISKLDICHFCEIWNNPKRVKQDLREGLKKKLKKRSGWPLGRGGGVTPPQPDRFYLWNFWPIFVLYKTANNPKYGNLSRIFTFTWPLRGRGGGSTQAVSLAAFSQFFLTPSLICLLIA